MKTSYNGYQANFIGEDYSVALPTLPYDLWSSAATIHNTKEYVLKYHHYSVVQHKERRLPLYTASNIDGSKIKAIPRNKIFSSGRDQWKKDKRIPYKTQLGAKFYQLDKSDFDRGHLTKREDTQWGSSEEKARLGAQSTFFYTNCTPQRKELNRAIWQQIENYILHQETKANNLKINVFSGPVLSDNDPIFVTPLKGVSIKIPTLFWKIIYYLKNQVLLSRVAFLVGQKHLLEKKGIVLKSRTISPNDNLFMNFSEAETYQVEVSLIEELTGLLFPMAIDIFKDLEPSVLERVQIRSLNNTQTLKGLVL